MATKKVAKSANGKTENELPSGYEKVGIDGPQAWHRPEVGATVEGVLLARHKRKKGPGYFYQLKLVKPTLAVRKDGETKETETVELEPGEVICVDERAALKDLVHLTKDKPGSWQVFLRCIEKVDIDNGQTFWRYSVGKKRIANLENDTDDSDVPF